MFFCFVFPFHFVVSAPFFLGLPAGRRGLLTISEDRLDASSCEIFVVFPSSVAADVDEEQDGAVSSKDDAAVGTAMGGDVAENKAAMVGEDVRGEDGGTVSEDGEDGEYVRGEDGAASGNDGLAVG